MPRTPLKVFGGGGLKSKFSDHQGLSLSLEQAEQNPITAIQYPESLIKYP